jgi:hypothetical protein
MEIILGIVALIFTIWALVDMLRSGITRRECTVWFIVILIFPFLGPLLWLIMRPKTS